MPGMGAGTPSVASRLSALIHACHTGLDEVTRPQLAQNQPLRGVDPAVVVEVRGDSEVEAAARHTERS